MRSIDRTSLHSIILKMVAFVILLLPNIAFQELSGNRENEQHSFVVSGGGTSFIFGCSRKKNNKHNKLLFPVYLELFAKYFSLCASLPVSDN